jgi:hypothetical protein
VVHAGRGSADDHTDDHARRRHVDHWLTSPRREQFFGPGGISARTCVDSERSNHVGLIVEVADMETLQQAFASPEAADAMKHDGVRPDTIHIMTAS